MPLLLLFLFFAIGLSADAFRACMRLRFLQKILCTIQQEIYYMKDSPENPNGPSREVHRESYQEALHILNAQEK